MCSLSFKLLFCIRLAVFVFSRTLFCHLPFVYRQDLAGDEQARALLGMADWLHAQGFHRQAADTYLKVTSCGAPARPSPPLSSRMLWTRRMIPEFSLSFFLF